MNVAACAAIVEKGDPPRFRATMAAPVAAREKLFPLLAFNVEVARAPWVTSEPGIAEIRLQWWIEALEEIAAGGVIRQHEVTVPLAFQLTPEQARALIPLVEARNWDIYSDPHADQAALITYLEQTSGRLMALSAALLGQVGTEPAQAGGLALGIANWLIAVPALKAAGRQPLPDEGPQAIAALAESGLAALARARKGAVVSAARPALYPLVDAGHVLGKAKRHPQAVLDGKLAPNPLGSHLRLMKAALTGRF
ncbi:squalene/phytoene synthase family protein [Aquicoccus sp. G2-2]|uniref:squalene/phytoene synthase family protein n=1 Tax=Aquicoccus sp. G2-2 TaxID=3092120 RepID=UPI002AE0890C|nr:squalene/phytoene synthase family protein [Aquicoccus sp. G2-2]MEA1112911.1 squalene/phytoene synthase family protein [Aquicoccus sp. G2-2]